MFSTQTRNRLATFVGKCRALLCGDFKSPGGEMARQLAHYGIQDTGKSFEVDSLSHLDEPGRETARTLRSVLAHKQANAPAAKVWKKFDAAVYDLIQEQGFTVLNRLCALRMAEERKILQFPCISKGLQSDGFELYEYHSGKANATIAKEDRFQHFVFSLFDELSLDLGSLFDRFSPQGLLFPAPKALAELLDLINDSALAHLWAEDETVGWIYQYWNSKEERKAMRDASAAPRNSRELAVRNQFFTPRYVVQFLTDNTLGRIWYEMCQGRTGLVDQCQYLVRRPNEIFLAEGEAAPEVTSDQSSVISEEALTQEELLKQPVYIPHRPLKDPREIRLLDPACGSMHFGLYAFDLYEKIYSEFWDLTSSSTSSTSSSSTDHSALITSHSSGSLHDLYPSKEAYMLEVPKMIIEHNIHGIDIDPRAAQIAGLALWLRAQRSWQAAGLLATQRPKVERSNIVCAEPMPGDKEQLQEFTKELHPAIAQMVETIFDKMELAGEAGSLLKIEEEITTLVEGAKAAWKQIGKHEGEMFSAAELVKNDLRSGTQTQLDIGSWNLETLSAISDSDFFAQAEQTIYKALSHYAESAGEGSYKRKLFAQDAAQGFAFIDLCRKRYDAVVMNPPFGGTSAIVTRYLKDIHGFGRPDAYMCFVFRCADLADESGRVGAITSRTFLTLQFFEYQRTLLLSGKLLLDTMLDLGPGVLDGATVETCAYVTENSKNKKPALFFDLINKTRIKDLIEYINDSTNGKTSDHLYVKKHSELNSIPGRVFAYRMAPGVLRSFANNQPIDPKYAMEQAGRETQDSGDVCVRQGLIPGDQFRFCRLWGEIPQHASHWLWAAKGGDYSRFISKEDVLINWDNVGDEMKCFAEINYGGASRTIKNESHFFKAGIAFPRVSSVGLNARVLNKSSIFTDTGMAVIPANSDQLLGLLGYLNSRFADYCCNSLHPGRKFEIAHIASLPIKPEIFSNTEISKIVLRSWQLVNERFSEEEDKIEFLMPKVVTDQTLGVASSSVHENRFTSTEVELAGLQGRLNNVIFEIFGISEDERSAIFLDLTEGQSAQKFGDDLSSNLKPFLAPEAVANIGKVIGPEKEEWSDGIAYLFGANLGRWDIRYTTGERQAPELPDPFDPLPVCPPGMLQNDSGSPLSNVELGELNAEGNYPLRITIEGILVDDPDHPEDIVRRVRDSLKVIWTDRADAIAQEACDILAVKELRDYFAEKRSGGKFFKDHLKRYSKSRRQAPIYWPLSTESGTYTLWIYYHRLTADTLYTAVQKFIEPKQEEAAKTFANLNAKTDRSKAEDKELETAQLLVAELATFRDSLLEIAKFWKPNLNDGVQITAAPLWKHFRLPAWQKKLKATWTSLQKGEYDWAHLAHSIWPDRVIPKCTTDRSLAIAHGHESALWEEVENAKGKTVWQPKKDAVAIAEELIKQHVK